MSSDITAGLTPAASPAAALTPEAIAAAAKRFSVATTKTYYGFNVRPRQVKSIACVRDAGRAADALDAGRLDPAIATAYAERLSAALAKAQAHFAAVEADEARAREAWSKATDRLSREALAREMRRHQGARWASADERRDDIAQALDIVRAALARHALKAAA